MDPLIGASLISAGSNLFGGVLGAFGAGSANSANMAMAQQQMMMQQNQFAEQMAWSREMAGNATRWDIEQRVNTAKEMGISPLVAMGSPSVSMPGIPTGDISGGGGNEVNPMSSIASAMGNLGQDVSRAAMATKTAEEKALIAAQTKKLLDDSRLTDAHVDTLRAQANYYNARALDGPPYPHVARGPLHDADAKTQSDTAQTTNRGTMEYQATPGTAAASGSFFESVLNMARNRLGMYGPHMDQQRIMTDISKKFPGAVGFKEVGLGEYRPVYPDEDVRTDVQNEVRSQRPWPLNYFK